MQIKNIFMAAIFLALLGSSSFAASMNLDIGPLKSKVGNILVLLYSHSAGFPTDMSKAFKRYRIAANRSQSDRVSLAIEDLEAGTYAISIIHDENEDDALEMGPYYIPAEGYGFSNNAKGMIGPPKFKKAALTLTAEQQVNMEIEIKY